MTPHIHFLGLVFFSVLIFAVQGMPTPTHPPEQKHSVTFFDENYQRVPKLPVGVKEQLEKRLHGLLEKKAPGQPFDIQWNIVETTARPDGKQPFNFMIQGGIFHDNPYPGFGWIQPSKVGNSGDFGSLYSYSLGTRQDRTWTRDHWASPTASTEEEQASKDFDDKFQAETMFFVPGRWESIADPKRKQEGGTEGGGKRGKGGGPN
ncbi:hypothetical protein BDP27DRAFT_1419837 [Rhodocollybia butyracea]|uniref:Uncharacterized protein n=1 Tax=Rhodocollybia butyracea TaxID=206335 RepID=A0A9P5U952_9AGAR|nr:hypothetical protein BDP27DRAFT_1419837 [Rhodocollybia butyracea]